VVPNKRAAILARDGTSKGPSLARALFRMASTSFRVGRSVLKGVLLAVGAIAVAVAINLLLSGLCLNVGSNPCG